MPTARQQGGRQRPDQSRDRCRGEPAAAAPPLGKAARQRVSSTAPSHVSSTAKSAAAATARTLMLLPKPGRGAAAAVQSDTALALAWAPEPPPCSPLPSSPPPLPLAVSSSCSGAVKRRPAAAQPTPAAGEPAMYRRLVRAAMSSWRAVRRSSAVCGMYLHSVSCEEEISRSRMGQTASWTWRPQLEVGGGTRGVLRGAPAALTQTRAAAPATMPRCHSRSVAKHCRPRRIGPAPAKSSVAKPRSEQGLAGWPTERAPTLLRTALVHLVKAAREGMIRVFARRLAQAAVVSGSGGTTCWLRIRWGPCYCKQTTSITTIGPIVLPICSRLGCMQGSASVTAERQCGGGRRDRNACMAE